MHLVLRQRYTRTVKAGCEYNTENAQTANK